MQYKREENTGKLNVPYEKLNLDVFFLFLNDVKE